MAWRGKVGEFLETYRSEMVVCFDWKISNITSMPVSAGYYYTSPSLKFRDTIWYLVVFLWGRPWTSKWITLILMRSHRGDPFRFSIGVKMTDGVEEMIRSRVVFPQHQMSLVFKSLLSDLGASSISQLALSDALTITCTIWKDAAVSARGNFHLSCGKLAEVAADEEKADIAKQNFSTLRKQLKDLLNSADDHDVTIRVRDREFSAHKCVLRARSTVFVAMFKHEMKESTDGSISVEDCDPDTFGEFLHYIYTGEVEDLSLGNAMELYYLADKYDVSGLKESCVHCLKTSLSVNAICDVLTFATTYDESGLLEHATNFFMENTREILATPEWRSLVRSNPDLSNDLYVKSFEMLHKKRLK